MVTRVVAFYAGRPVHLTGHGYFAGEAPATSDPGEPDGRAKITNAPARVHIGVFQRQTMICVASVLSDADGLWRVSGLQPALPFTVIGFDNAGEVNAAIQDWVRPAPYDPSSLRPMKLVGRISDSDVGGTVLWKVRAAYAVGEVSYTVTAGALPPGWSIDSQETSCIISGTSVALGIYSFELTGVDGLGTEASETYTVEVLEAFAYWRIVVTDNNGDPNYSTIVEVEMRANPGTADQCVGGTATASTFANTDNLPAYAFDNNSATKWTTASKPTSLSPQWLRYQFPAPVAVRQVAMTASIIGQTAMAPQAFTIERSHDGVVWEIAATVAGESGWAANETRLFTF